MMRKVRPSTCAWDPPSPPAKILGKLARQRHGVTPPHVLNLLAAPSTYFSSPHPLQALAVKTPSNSPVDAGNSLLAWPKGSENVFLKLTRHRFCNLRRSSAPKAPAEGGAVSAPKYTHCPPGMGHSPQNGRWHWRDARENISPIRCYSWQTHVPPGQHIQPGTIPHHQEVATVSSPQGTPIQPRVAGSCHPGQNGSPLSQGTDTQSWTRQGVSLSPTSLL